MKNSPMKFKGIFLYASFMIFGMALLSCGGDDGVTVTPPDPPTVTAIDPSSGLVGTEVSITGTNFGTTTSDVSVSFNGTDAVVTASTETSITTTVPDGATTGAVSVTIGTTVVQGGPTFTVTVPPVPTVVSLDPVSGDEGATVTITGTNFSTTASENEVSFNGTAATVTAATVTTITTTVPVGATTGPVTVTVLGQVVTGPEFTVIAVPKFTSLITSNVTTKLGKVHFADATTAYVAGDDGTVLKSTDSGTTWTDLTSSTGITDDFEAVFFVDANTGWAVGDDGIVINTTDGGANWTDQTANTGTTETLRSIFFLDANNGFVGGSDGVMITTTDGGASWSTQATGLEEVTTVGMERDGERVYDIYFWNSTNGIAVAGGGDIITTTDGGTTWALQEDVNGADESWKAIQFTDANTGWVVGSAGFIYKTEDGGASWTAQTSPTTEADFNDLILLSDNTLIAVGDHNEARDITSFVAVTVDGGTTWTRQDHMLTLVADDIELNGVASFDGTTIIAVGDDGTILK
ncbi:YCF48-related protein [Ekhidna sp.]